MATRIVIWLEGGLIDEITADDDAEVLVLDRDTEFAHKEDKMILNTYPKPKPFGKETYPSIPLEFFKRGIEEVDVEPALVSHYFDQVEDMEDDEREEEEEDD
jgi:hypothetical protein